MILALESSCDETAVAVFDPARFCDVALRVQEDAEDRPDARAEVDHAVHVVRPSAPPAHLPPKRKH